jgi:hypothetical protein
MPSRSGLSAFAIGAAFIAALFFVGLYLPLALLSHEWRWPIKVAQALLNIVFEQIWTSNTDALLIPVGDTYRMATERIIQPPMGIGAKTTLKSVVTN